MQALFSLRVIQIIDALAVKVSRASALAFRIAKLLPYQCRRYDANRASICFVEFRFVEKVLPLWGSSTTTAKINVSTSYLSS